MVTWIYANSGFTPSAKIRNGDKFSIINDYLGTPIQAYNEFGEKIWERELSIYGETRVEKGLENFIPFTYQGQYFDSEIELCYNRFRYYDVKLGLYLSKDPIGLAGSLNLYSYVENSNVELDIFGLAPIRVVNGTTIFDKGQTTGLGHAQLSEVLANKMAMSGKFKEVHLNRSYEAITGNKTTPKRSPDITGIGNDGRVHSIEIASESDMRGSNLQKLTDRNKIAQAQLPSNKQGEIIIIEKPYKADAVKSKMDGFIKYV